MFLLEGQGHLTWLEFSFEFFCTIFERFSFQRTDLSCPQFRIIYYCLLFHFLLMFGVMVCPSGHAVDVFRIQLKLAFVFVFGFRFSPQLFCCSSFIVLFVYSAFIIVFWHDISSCRQLVYRYPAAAILAISVAILNNCLMHVCLLFSSVAILLTCL